MPSRRILTPLLVTFLVLIAVLPAQAQDLDPLDRPQADGLTALVDVPVPTEPRLPSVPAAAEVIAERWLAAVSDEQRRDVMLEVLSGIGMGVYTMDGRPILYGAEQDVADPWLYDFEVAISSVDPALATPVTVADIAASLDAVIADAAGMPIDPQTLADQARSSIAEALAEPSDPVGFPLRLAREVELLASGRDLAIEVPVEEPLTSLAALLLELDLVMPFATLPDPEVAVVTTAYAPVLARLDRPAHARRDHDQADAQLPQTAQICDRIGSWAGKQSWDIGKLGARVLKGSAIIAGASGYGQLLHRVYLRRAIEVIGYMNPNTIHYRHPPQDDAGDVQFSVHVGVRFELPPEVRGCGALAGLAMPKRGVGLPNIAVQWLTGSLGDHGVISCPPETCLKTDEVGTAVLSFVPKSEPEMPVLGREKYDRTLVITRVNYALDLGNAYGQLPLAGAWRFRDVRIGWHEPYRYKASGGGEGLSVAGTVEALDTAFTLKGDFPGGSAVFNFAPTSGLKGLASYSLSGSGVTGSGEGKYDIKVNKDRTLTLTAKTKGCVKGVAGSCRARTSVITLTPIEP